MSKLKFSLKAISVVAGMVVGVMAPMHAATAGTVNLAFNGAAYGYENFNLQNGNPYVSDYNQPAGGFTMKVNTSNDPQFKTGSSILTWCIELTQSITQGSNYNYTTTDLTAANPSWAGRLQELIAQNYQTVLSAANSITSAAMQLAIWEVVNESANSNLDLSSGNFRASAPLFNGDSTSARDMAQGWLNNLSSSADTGKYKIVMLSNGSAQDLVTVLPTPIPAAALLFGSALGLGGLMQRRRRATPAAVA
ncbi:VPLPA-CTERM sorting domain-containing protein [Extensimonas sp. H3M7-6]|uniref:VPLPA-CTERM sorting domain-containing protein n=1 Tax=Extensimonas soli TaxID=3031322 RepID=UPI0023DB3D60|nr:VPLPA-CTERM sorting domain-containing protein [Extensimonas sp. H3M7-6]MDF1483447.1 VPLPA-CTERM sorting domain-containing protein [Extensimonas sp. H3M7-6]